MRGLNQDHRLEVVRRTEGFQICSVCGGSGYPNKKNSFSTECPQIKLSSIQLNLIFRGRVDFIQREWVQKSASI